MDFVHFDILEASALQQALTALAPLGAIRFFLYCSRKSGLL